MKKKIVFVGLSGGVDSAVSAALLQSQGFEVVGVFIKTWHPEIFPCNEEEERHDAMRVAACLDIPFLTFDFKDVYKKEVADYMIREYKAGRTPNPDVMCNKEVKFGAFLKKALAMGADFVATGHYAQNSPLLVEEGVGGGDSKKNHLALKGTPPQKGGEKFLLRQSLDPSKDQSYFLWTLTQKQLEKILFPIGHLRKTQVRGLAKKFNLPVAEKKDSQGICFLGDIDLKKFLKHYIKEKKGDVVLAPGEAGNEKGEKIGYHDGIFFHTLGERHGFVVTKKSPTDGAYYIVGKDIKKNILIVSQHRVFSSPLIRGRLGGGELKSTSPQPSPYKGEGKINLKDANWISKTPEPNKNYTAQIRYHGEFLSCKINCGSKASAEIIFEKPVLVASGQSCVIYDKDVCLGGGVVV